MLADEKARLGRVLADAFDLGERIARTERCATTQARVAIACDNLSRAIGPALSLGDADPAKLRVHVASALVMNLALAHHLGAADTFADVDRIVREFSAGLDRRLEREG